MLFHKKASMKNIAAILTLFIGTFFLHTEARAQGNLQFNQVILVDLASGGAYNIIVPPGKVWKIESSMNYNGSSGAVGLRNAAVQAIGILGSSSSNAASTYPFWLPSGFTGSFLNVSAGRSCVSIIEFNVVP
jgi:hypothetical protein